MFKVGDKVQWKFKDRDYWIFGVYTVQDKHPEDFTPRGELIGVQYDDKGLYLGYIKLDNPRIEYKLVEEKKEMTHKYNEGQWYMWDGKGDFPLHPKDIFRVKVFDCIYGQERTQDNLTINGCWSWDDGKVKVYAFYITKKYKEPETVEMTVEEIRKVLGKNIKVVK